MEIRTAGLLGLGKMGGPMAKHLAAKGFAVVGYDPLAAAREQAAAHGAKIAQSPR
jgi:3-hydroxyisobutyrate dehydrogenase-like beta-hydroxyacid dehydrogenase